LKNTETIAANPFYDAIGQSFSKMDPGQLSGLAIVAAILAYQGYKSFQGDAGLPKIEGSAYWAKSEHIKNAKAAVARNRASDKLTDFGWMLGNIPLSKAVLSSIWYGAPEKGKTYGGWGQEVYNALKDGQTTVILDFQYPQATRLYIPIAQKLGYPPEDIYTWLPGEETSGVYNPSEFNRSNFPKDFTRGEYSKLQAEQQYENFTKTDAKEDDFFTPAGKLFLRAGLSAASVITEVYPDFNGMLGLKAIAALNDLPKRLLHNKEKLRELDFWVYDDFSQFLANAESPKTADSIRGAAGNIIAQAGPSILRSMIGPTSFPMYLDGSKLLIVGSRAELISSVAPYMMSFLASSVKTNAVMGRQTPIGYHIDEFAMVKYLPIVNHLNELRKFGVYFNLAAQTPWQLKDKLGDKLFEAFMTGVGHSFWFSTGNSKESAAYLESLLGKEKYREKSRTTGSSGGKNSNSTATSIKERPLMAAAKIRTMPPQVLIALTPGISTSRDGVFKESDEVSIPWKVKVKADPEYVHMVKQAEKDWPFVEAQLKKYSLQTREDIGELLLTSEAIAEEFFSLPPSEEDIAQQEAIEESVKGLDDFYGGLLGGDQSVVLNVMPPPSPNKVSAVDLAKATTVLMGRKVTLEEISDAQPLANRILDGQNLAHLEEAVRIPILAEVFKEILSSSEEDEEVVQRMSIWIQQVLEGEQSG
jgi:type IV secretory pathway TraG/TraD family ATPase VirD4